MCMNIPASISIIFSMGHNYYDSLLASLDNVKLQTRSLLLWKRIYSIRSKLFLLKVPYFFGYKAKFFFLPKQSKNLDPSYKTDLDFWDCFGRVKLVLQHKKHIYSAFIWVFPSL